MKAKLAFSYVLHDYVGMFEVLLHMTFRPYNSYCIYIDAHAKEVTRNAISAIINCYQEIFPHANIFLAESPIKINWGGFSLQQADLSCLQQLKDSDRSDPCYFLIKLSKQELNLLTV